MTQMYNVQEALRQGRELTAAERKINEQGLVTLLADIHRRLDAAVAQAYGWPADLPEAEILERLVELNRRRAQEEERGVIRWLRPEYQAARRRPAKPKQARLKTEPAKSPAKPQRPDWPKGLADRTRAVLDVLTRAAGPVGVDDIRKAYRYAHTKQVEEILETLISLGQVTRLADGRYVKH